MASHPRYEIVNTIAAGDFATVFRARDRSLGREVAIKQIHPQFLGDQRQLARYWQEAQLLATLQHPNVLTIYDIDRPRGWLILELMQASLKQMAQGEPMDLDFLRLGLACALSALGFLHANGVIHGDVKPSNLLVDAQYRVKLGDFGLARRVVSDEGSLLKGTTKYMAPELVSNQFGPVGPPSDLYSLGFSAYELMCGPQFESLFPGLSGFGRDKQVAWMMWHAAADRNLPEIGRVLQGVPADLARVISRLALKDQGRRYHSAEEALADLRADRLGPMALPAKPPVVDDAPKIRRRRLAIAGSVVLALVAVLALVFLLPGEKKKGPARPVAVEPTRGIIREVDADGDRFTYETADAGERRSLAIRHKDRIFINDKETRVFRDLRPGDRIAIRILRDENKGSITEVHATRAQMHKGRISAVKPDLGALTLSVTEGEEQGKSRLITVPPNVKILLNGREETTVRKKGLDGKEDVGTRPVTLADLQLDDRAVVSDIAEETGLLATELAVERVVTFAGVLRQIDVRKAQLTFALGEGDNAELFTLPYARDCQVTINGRRFMDAQVLKPGDLHPGDKAVRVAHDTRIVSVDVVRVLGQAGVVEKVDYAARLLDVTMEGTEKLGTFHAGPDTKISFGSEPAELDDLRSGDVVDLTLDSPDAKTPEARLISVRRPSDAARWAVLVGIDQYDDPAITPLTTPGADARHLFDVLTRRYRVPEEQTLLLAAEQTLRVRLEQAIPNLLGRAPAESQVLVYFAGHAYQDSDGAVYLAPKNFQLANMAAEGLKLQWLVDRLEECPAKEKLLLLDCTYAGEGKDLANEPATADMLRTLKGPPGYAPLRTVTAIASCRTGQRGGVVAGPPHSLFASCLADGFSGRADTNRDTRVEPTELFGYLTTAMGAAGAKAKLVQAPELFLPDARPPRLSEEAQKALRKLASLMHQDRLDASRVQEEYGAAQQAAGQEPEPKLLYGLLLLKTRRRDDAVRVFQEVGAELPEHLVPPQAMAWLQFDRMAYPAGIHELINLVARIPPTKTPGDPLPEPAQRLFTWIGQLREFASLAAPENRRLADNVLEALDAAVEQRGPEAVQRYGQGQSKVRNVAMDYDKKIGSASDEGAAAKARIDRRQLSNYAVFPFDDAVQAVLATLDQGEKPSAKNP